MPREPGFVRFFDSRVGRVLRDHHLLHHDDTILVAAICPSDGLSLLALLHRLRRPVPPLYALRFAAIRPAGSPEPAGWREALVRVAAEAGAPVHDVAIEASSPPGCAACRAAALCAAADLARQTGCTAVALADSLDTLAEDVLVGLVGHGELRRVGPLGDLVPGVRLLRPFATSEARQVRRYARELGLPEGLAPCPDGAAAGRPLLPEVLAALGGKPAPIKFNLVRAARHVAVVTLT